MGRRFADEAKKLVPQLFIIAQAGFDVIDASSHDFPVEPYGGVVEQGYIVLEYVPESKI